MSKSAKARPVAMEPAWLSAERIAASRSNMVPLREMVTFSVSSSFVSDSILAFILAVYLIYDSISRPHPFVTSEIHLYGKTQKIRHHALDLWWLGVFVRFVLSVNPEGRRGIFVSTDISLTAEEILKAYGFRFKIEDGFKSFIHTIFGMSYRFWMKAMTRTKRGMGNIYLHRSGDRIRASVLRKLEAYERFTNLAAIAMGMLQLLGLTVKEAAGAGGLYFRTPPKLAMPSVLGVRCALQGEIRGIFDRNEAKPLLAQLLGEMKRAVTAPHPMKVAA